MTARDFAQTLQLLDRFAIEHTAIGHHRGERLADKAVGLASRSTALVRWARRESAHRPARAVVRGGGSKRRPHSRRSRRESAFDIALGHGSNDVSVAARLLRIPCSTTFDYEWAAVQHHVNCRLAQAVVVPDAIPPERLDRYGAKGKITPTRGSRRSTTSPTSSRTRRCLASLRSTATRPLVVVRTPPEVSLYHRFENDLFAERARASADAAAASDHGVQSRRDCRAPCGCSVLAASADVEGFTVPERAIDAQSLIAFADLVISAGGTMNREAVALGTPVYTTFEGRLGAVDERLIAEGRLRKLGGVGQLDLAKRDGPTESQIAHTARPTTAGGAAAFAT